MRILVTGGGSGIGKALVEQLCKYNCQIIIVGRRIDLLKSVASICPEKIFFIQADIGNEIDRLKIVDEIKKGPHLTHVVHNAAVVEPVSLINEINLEQYRNQQAINIEGPLFLTKGLLEYSSLECRFLFISSEAADNPWEGISSYCISKAALEMVCKSYKTEFTDKGKGFYFTNLRPGGVKTPMSEKLSKTSTSFFPSADIVLERISKGNIFQPEFCAKFIEWVLIKTSNELYQKWWDIDNEEDKNLWVGFENKNLEHIVGNLPFFLDEENSLSPSEITNLYVCKL